MSVCVAQRVIKDTAKGRRSLYNKFNNIVCVAGVSAEIVKREKLHTYT